MTRFTTSKPCPWNQPRQPLSPTERLRRHGKVQPMQPEGFWKRLWREG